VDTYLGWNVLSAGLNPKNTNKENALFVMREQALKIFDKYLPK